MLGYAKFKSLPKLKGMRIKHRRNKPYQSGKSKKVDDDRNENNKGKSYFGFLGFQKT